MTIRGIVVIEQDGFNENCYNLSSADITGGYGEDIVEFISTELRFGDYRKNLERFTKFIETISDGRIDSDDIPYDRSIHNEPEDFCYHDFGYVYNPNKNSLEILFNGMKILKVQVGANEYIYDVCIVELEDFFINGLSDNIEILINTLITLKDKLKK